MLLALDIGNSTIVAALFDKEKKLAETTVSSTVQRSRDETWDIVQPLINQTEGDALDGVGISSVVPFLTHVFTTLSREKLGIEPLIISGSLDLGITIHYDDPTTLGSDRICSAIAAYAKYHGPLIVIDFGTATTYGVVSANGDFLGGAISLGVRSTAEALFRRTAKLPDFQLQAPLSPIARDTVSAMQAGTVFSAIGAVEGMVKRIKNELRTDARVIATGGLATMMAAQTTIFEAVEPDLVLEGVRLICQRMLSGTKPFSK
jgi:type III pantothenate kinase